MTVLNKLIATVAVAATLLASANVASAQIVRGEAVAGEPFGVGRVTVRLGEQPIVNPQTNLDIGIEEANGRIFYPTYAAGPVRQFIRQFIQPTGITVYFLFQGNEPLDVTLYTPEPTRLRIQPQDRRGRRNLNLASWWREYLNTAELHRRDSEFPNIADAYLTEMLSQRLRLPIPEERQRLFEMELGENIGLLLGTEENQQRMIRAVMAGVSPRDYEGDNPLPNVQIPAAEIPPIEGEVEIESLAAHVPEECFYLRTGDYANYVWMQTTMEEFGGDLARMISHRSINLDTNAKTEAQLGLKETALSRMLGGTLISDVAIIGTDMFFKEGPSMGILFEARNNFLLRNNLNSQRQEAKAQHEDAVEETIEVGDVKVSFIHTPDNRLRSYYVIDGDYHLVTTSRTIVERFLEAGSGERPLSQSPDFIYARSKMPVERKETIFVYLSDAFWRNLASPQYRIEAIRRNQSIASMQVMEMARWAAWGEGYDTSKLSTLIDAGFLPEGFGKNFGGGKIVVNQGDDGLVYSDSLRGARGSFLPVADVEFSGISDAELASYNRFLDEYNNAAARLDPMAIGIRRYKTDQRNVEEVAIEAHVLPLSSGNWDSLTQYLGPATTQRLARLPSDMLRLDVVTSGVTNDYVFFGLEEFNPPLMVRNGRVGWSLPNLNTSRGYLGGAPDLGFVERLLNLLDMIPRGDTREFGYSRLILGLWRYRVPELTVLSFNKPVLDRVIPQLRWIEAARPAQIRLHIGDLSQTTLHAGGNALGFQRAIDVSNGNAVFIHELHNQLHVPLKDARQVAELLLNAELDCPLDGKYALVAPGDAAVNRPQWRSTAATRLASFNDIPQDYEFPIQTWFRGLNAEVEAQPNQLSLRANVLMKRDRLAPGGEARPGLPAEPELIKAEPEPLDDVEGEVLPEPVEGEELPGKPLVPEENLPTPGEELPPPAEQPSAELPGGVQLPFEIPGLPRGGEPPARPAPPR